jgi:hypothetical protein
LRDKNAVLDQVSKHKIKAARHFELKGFAIGGLRMLSKKHQYSAYHFAVLAVDDPEISLYLPECFPV